MVENLPDYLSQGERARLFPVLSTTSKEGRTTSIVLACLYKADELAARLLKGVGQKIGVRTRLETYTEVVFKKGPNSSKDRPDGLIVLKTGSRIWRALVESKVGSNELQADQIEKYRSLAKENDIDCVITISNQFSSTPNAHPLEAVRKSRSKIPVFHWSWMHVLTEVDLLLSNDAIADSDQRLLLNELRRFLSHESAGVRGFDRMPKEWSDLNKLISSGGDIPSRSKEAEIVVNAWHQELRDLSLILSRMTETSVIEKLSRKHRSSQAQRIQDDLALLRDKKQLKTEFEIADAASTISVLADLKRRCVDVGMTLRAPEDKVSTKARLNWILRQIKSDKIENLYIRLLWPGTSGPTQYLVEDLRNDPSRASEGKQNLVPHSFHLFEANVLGARFGQLGNFVTDLETVVPRFYRDFGSRLSAWKPSAPKIKESRSSSTDVSTDSIANNAQNFE